MFAHVMCMPWHNHYGAFNFQTPCRRWCLVGYQLSRSFKNGSSHLLPFHFLLQCYCSSARREMLWNFRCSASNIDFNSCLLRKHIITQYIPRKTLSEHLNWYLLWVVFRIRNHVYTRKHNLYFLVMVHISTQGDCVPVLSFFAW